MSKIMIKFFHSIFLACHLYSVLFKMVASQSVPIAEPGKIKTEFLSNYITNYQSLY